ncbi:MAG: DUF3276 family protein [Bacteroidota bacterium]
METKEATGRNERDDVFSRYVRAGKRTYFFDVKTTRADDYYLTITESTRRYNDDGTFHYEKHRIFLYKEDFEKFSNRLNEVMDFIIREKGEIPIRGISEGEEKITSPQKGEPVSVAANETEGKTEEKPVEEKFEETAKAAETNEFTDVSFEDLGEVSEIKEEAQQQVIPEATVESPEEKEEKELSSEALAKE